MEQTDEEILARPALEHGEVVLRALHEPYWDPQHQRGTPSAFKGNRISVSRLAVLSEEEIVAIWKRDLENSTRRIEGVATICVADIVACGSQGLLLSVTADATKPNPAHAEIIGTDQSRSRLCNISRGIGNQILQRCTTKTIPSS